jgi:hypothetical protein
MPSPAFPRPHRVSRATMGSTILAGILLILGATRVAASGDEAAVSHAVRP